MELRQLGQEDTKKGDCVDQEVGGVIFGVKAGQHVSKRGQQKKTSTGNYMIILLLKLSGNV